MKKKKVNREIVENLKDLEIYDSLEHEDLENTNDYKNFVDACDKVSLKRKSGIKKLLIGIFIIIVFVVILVLIMFYFNQRFYVQKINVISYDYDSDMAVLEVIYDRTLEGHSCAIGHDNKDLKWFKCENKSCQVSVLSSDIEYIYLKNSMNDIIVKPYVVSSLVLDANFSNDDIIYLAREEEYTLNSVNKYVGEAPRVDYRVEDTNVAVVNNNVLKAVSGGKTKVGLYLNDKSYGEKELVVTSLIVKMPKKFNSKKPYLPCGIYSSEEAKLMDEILFSRIAAAGYETRAGVVAAARFLLLSFPYRIDYFFENGRVSGTGVNYADGEGRYYHRGLYLHKDKFKDIKYTFAGPVIWGCPLTNYEDFGKYVYGKKMPNGLDCSGFVSWVLLNGGFDVGDRGAGETYEDFQMTDLGKRVKLTKTFVDTGVIKPGDLLNWWGHIAIIIGVDDNNYYVAESLDTYEGVVLKTYSKKTLADDWTYVMLMDSVYKKDGNLTNMWY